MKRTVRPEAHCRRAKLLIGILWVICVICGFSSSAFAGSWPDFSNGNGGSWLGGYYRPITVTNSTGAPLTDYQIPITPFTDANFINNTGLVASYHFSEGAGTTTADMSGNGNTGTWNGTGAHWAAGKFGNGGQFNGTDDYINAGNDATLNITSNLSLETWIYPTALGNTLDRSIIDKYGALGTAYSMRTIDSKVRFVFYAGGSWRAYQTNNQVLAINNWYHVVISYPNVTIYVNGSAVPGSWVAGAETILITNTDPLTIAGGPSLSAFQGQIDETKIYNRTLTAAEITTRYNYYTTKLKGDYSDLRFTQTLGVGNAELSYWQETDNKFWLKIPNLPTGISQIYMYYGNSAATSSSSTTTFIREVTGVVGSWPFSEGAGITTADMSGNGNTGTLTNVPAWVDGKFGKALSFNGTNNNVSMGNVLNMGTGDFSVEGWVYITKTAPANNEWDIISKHTDGQAIPNTWDIEVSTWGGGIGIGWYSLDNSTYASGGGKGVAPNTWVHFVYIRTGTTITSYFNGVFNAAVTNAIHGTNFSNTQNFTIGGSNFWGNGYFGGVLDEVHIYNRALTAAEITDLYNNYGYTTINYPGKSLVRKYASPEPAATAPGAEAQYTLTKYIQRANWTSIVKAANPVAMGNAVAVISFTAVATGTNTAHWRRFRIDETGGQPVTKLTVSVYEESGNDGFFDAGDRFIASGTFNNNRMCILNMNRWPIGTTPKTYYIVEKVALDGSGGATIRLNIVDGSYFDFEEGPCVGVPP